MSDEKRQFWENFFDECDKTGEKDGKLSIHELRRKLGPDPADSDIANIFADLDKNGDGVISRVEFMTEMMKLSAKEAAEKYKECFKKWDKNGNGKLNKDELKGVIREMGNFTDEEIDLMISREDVNKDGEIDFPEFCKMMGI